MEEKCGMSEPNKKLRAAREQKYWSQEEAAAAIGIDRKTYIRWENGQSHPQPAMLGRACKAFGKTAEELGFLQPGNDIPLRRMPRIEEGTISRSAEAKAEVSVRGNPFTYGNPISDPQRFFGRRHEVEQVFSRLRNAEFESSSLVGERRIGKTSLLKYLAHPVVRQSYGLDPDNYLFIYIDLQIVDEKTTSVRLWHWLLRQIASCCSDPHVKQLLEEIQQTQSVDNFALEDVFDSIDAKEQYVVLLLDEFEHVTENPNFTAAFFYGLRSLAIHHHLSLITSSRRELIELCHSQAIRSSPFFNIFANINVGLFTKNEALDLLSQSLTGTGIRFTDTEIETIFRLAGYHPYFLQIACSFLFDAYSKNLNPQERVISLHRAFREEAGPHLASYWYNSDDQEKLVLTALTFLQEQCRLNGPAFSMRQLQELAAGSSPTLARLEKRGLVVSTTDGCSLFNESFGEWIWHEITDTRRNQLSYEEWLTSNKPVTDRLKGFPEETKQEVDEILSKMNAQYRELLLHWLNDPGMFIIVGRLIEGTGDLGRY
jgi:transcriptional regulator with XRE-family HTH domain